MAKERIFRSDENQEGVIVATLGGFDVRLTLQEHIDRPAALLELNNLVAKTAYGPVAEDLLQRMESVIAEGNQKVEAVIVDSELVRVEFVPIPAQKKRTVPPDENIWLQEFRCAGYDTWKKLVDAGITGEQAPAAAVACSKSASDYADAMLAGYQKHRDKGGLHLADEN